MTPDSHPPAAPALSSAEREEIRQRAEKAKQGPWYEDEHHISAEDGFIVCDFIGKHVNRDFIAHARTDIPRLLDSLDAADAERQRMHDHWHDTGRTMTLNPDSRLSNLRAEIARLREGLLEGGTQASRFYLETDKQIKSLDKDNKRLSAAITELRGVLCTIDWGPRQARTLAQQGMQIADAALSPRP